MFYPIEMGWFGGKTPLFSERVDNVFCVARNSRSWSLVGGRNRRGRCRSWSLVLRSIYVELTYRNRTSFPESQSVQVFWATVADFWQIKLRTKRRSWLSRLVLVFVASAPLDKDLVLPDQGYCPHCRVLRNIGAQRGLLLHCERRTVPQIGVQCSFDICFKVEFLKIFPGC